MRRAKIGVGVEGVGDAARRLALGEVDKDAPDDRGLVAIDPAFANLTLDCLVAIANAAGGLALAHPTLEAASGFLR